MSDEKTFLSNYNMNDYERPSVTADIIAFMIRSQESGNYRRNSKTSLKARRSPVQGLLGAARRIFESRRND